MSAWGKLDRREMPAIATAKTVVNNANILLSTAEVRTAANGFVVGYALLIGNIAYTMANVTIGTANILLDTNYRGATTAAANIAIQESPKWISTNNSGNVWSGYRSNLVNKANVYGVDRTEVGIAGTKANGISHTGWVSYKTYQTSQNTAAGANIRHKSEVLVAMSKNFNANATGTLQTDANDNNILPNS